MFYSKSTDGFYDTAIHGDNIPSDAVEITTEQHQALLEGQLQGKIIAADENGYPILVDPPDPTPEQIVARYTAGVQQHLDTFAQTRNYDGILSAATYATSQVPKFKAEGQYAVESRSRPMLTLDELLAELPVLAWPN